MARDNTNSRNKVAENPAAAIKLAHGYEDIPWVLLNASVASGNICNNDAPINIPPLNAFIIENIVLFVLVNLNRIGMPPHATPSKNRTGIATNATTFSLQKVVKVMLFEI